MILETSLNTEVSPLYIVKQCDIKLLEYVVKILDESRTKKRAIARVNALLRLRKNLDANVTVYSREEIDKYIHHRKEK